MAATVIRFDDAKNPPRTVFVDSSFIRALIQWSSDPGVASAAAAHGFYDRAKRANARLWTTPFTAEEILWAYVRRALQDTCRTYGIVSIGDLKRERRGDYARTIESCRPEILKMITALNRLKISFEFPGDQAAVRGTWGQMVWRAASQILDRFPIETADAFHIACATVGGTDHIASLDSDFREVDGLTIYCYM